VAAVDSVVAEGTPLPLTAVAGLSGVILVAALAMSVRAMSVRAMSQEHPLTRLDVETHPTMRLD
jgi:hypothetical protein